MAKVIDGHYSNQLRIKNQEMFMELSNKNGHGFKSIVYRKFKGWFGINDNSETYFGNFESTKEFLSKKNEAK